ncbi:MAG: hypothetical protein CM1200mP30_26280 [Pseudomonadota bacterium]|nr:MAG: hypothetical protein CM1200mP30_26280 [Pseudomonadota bacterium]
MLLPFVHNFSGTIFFHEKLSKRNLYGIDCYLGLALMATLHQIILEHSFRISSSRSTWGLGGGLGFALFTLLNRGMCVTIPTASHMLAEWFCCKGSPPWSLFESWVLTITDWTLLFVLGVVCT